MSFKVGDVVRLKRDVGLSAYLKKGLELTVSDVYPQTRTVTIVTPNGYCHHLGFNNAELIPDPNTGLTNKELAEKVRKLRTECLSAIKELLERGFTVDTSSYTYKIDRVEACLSKPLTITRTTTLAL